MRFIRSWESKLFDAIAYVGTMHVGTLLYRFDNTEINHFRFWNLYVSLFIWFYYNTSLMQELANSRNDKQARRAVRKRQSIYGWVVILCISIYSITTLTTPSPIPNVATGEYKMAIMYLILVILLILQQPTVQRFPKTS